MWKDKQRTNRSNHGTRFAWRSGLLPVCEHVPSKPIDMIRDRRRASSIRGKNETPMHADRYANMLQIVPGTAYLKCQPVSGLVDRF